MNALLGFAVLTSPLWLILVLLPIAGWIAVKVARRFERRGSRIAVGLLVFLLIFFTPFADGIAGRIYFNYLCATKAGVKVYKTVELPAEDWDKSGRPKFYNGKEPNPRLSAYRVKYRADPHSPFFHIDNAGYQRIDGRSGEVLGEVISFRYWGGWVKRMLSPHNTATSCEGGSEHSNELMRQVFKPKQS